MIVQSTATDARLTKTQKIAYGVVTVGGQYVMERVNGIVTEQGWGELPEVHKPGDRPVYIIVPVIESRDSPYLPMSIGQHQAQGMESSSEGIKCLQNRLAHQLFGILVRRQVSDAINGTVRMAYSSNSRRLLTSQYLIRP